MSNSALPGNAFIDRDGNETLDPDQVDAVLPFGEHKGSALCLAIELMAGTLAAAAMGGKVSDEYSLGAVFLAVSPRPGAYLQVNDLIREIAGSLPVHGVETVYVPGQGSVRRKREGIQRGWVEIADSTYQLLQEMANGGSGLKSSLLTN